MGYAKEYKNLRKQTDCYDDEGYYFDLEKKKIPKKIIALIIIGIVLFLFILTTIIICCTTKINSNEIPYIENDFSNINIDDYYPIK